MNFHWALDQDFEMLKIITVLYRLFPRFYAGTGHAELLYFRNLISEAKTIIVFMPQTSSYDKNFFFKYLTALTSLS